MVRDDGARALLTTLQWTDSAFPSGLYTLSHGLEGLMQAGWAGAESLEDVIASLLRHSVGPADTAATFLAHRAAEAGDVDGPAGVAAVDRELTATRLTDAMRRGSTRVGRQLLTMAGELNVAGGVLGTYREAVAGRRADANQAVACAVVQQALGVPARQCAAAELAGWVNGVAGAAIRLRLTDHIGAQRLVARLAPVIMEVLADAEARPLSEIGSASPVLDVAAALHETAEARLFLN
ncbi:urease accessory protein UreF [Corynebacterium sp.]|uniref:urease accessory protein UreF n=1 Tax=Corynebacterium sp. TaxID=1720 RepID=UPI0026DD77BD|nr:urease accessory UreF family protein [Corynebacterium sp.]MDO4609213.1 urease accessory UreF family protein [Corynebacterium sp.]